MLTCQGSCYSMTYVVFSRMMCQNFYNNCWEHLVYPPPDASARAGLPRTYQRRARVAPWWRAPYVWPGLTWNASPSRQSVPHSPHFSDQRYRPASRPSWTPLGVIPDPCHAPIHLSAGQQASAPSHWCHPTRHTFPGRRPRPPCHLTCSSPIGLPWFEAYLMLSKLC